jgi:hypothetical protein
MKYVQYIITLFVLASLTMACMQDWLGPWHYHHNLPYSNVTLSRTNL